MYAVLFDIDGTLILTGGAGQRTFVETFRHDFEIPEPTGKVAFAGRSDRAIALDLMELNGVEPSEENWHRFQQGYCQRLQTELDSCTGEVLPGVLELLDTLEPMEHVALGLLTGNLQHGAQAKLRHYGLAERFAFGGFGDHHTERNDIATSALQAAQHHANANSNGAPSTVTGAMVIGDTVNDITCARSIGAFAVAVQTGNTPVEELAACEPDLLLADLSDYQALLDEIHANGKG